MRREEILAELGLDRMPAARIPVPDEQPPIAGSSLLNFKKAVQMVDILESAAFEKYIPLDVEIDQSLDARTFHPELSKAIMFRTDVPIPSNEMVKRATGIGPDHNHQNQYKWLAQEVRRHYLEFGVVSISVPLVFRWASGRPPVLGCILKLSPKKRYEGAGANWALLTEKKIPKIGEDED